MQRIEYIRNYLGLNKSRFSTEIGLKPQTYNNFIGAQASKPSVELVLGIVNRFGVNPGWILNGNGAVFNERAADQEARFGAPGSVPGRARLWGDQVAEPGQPSGWEGEPEGELQKKVSRLESLVHSLEERVESIGSPVPGLRELNAMLTRLHGADPGAAQKQLSEIQARIKRQLEEEEKG